MTTASDNKNAAPAAAAPVRSDEQLLGFWAKNRGAILAAGAIVLLAVVAKGGWELYTARQEQSLAAEFQAADAPEKLRAFARAHQTHLLAGVAGLSLADEEYAAGKYSEAAADYALAAGRLQGTGFGGRALLGAAICKLQSGRTAEGEAQLSQLASDLAQPRSVRTEAAYHLASEAADAGRLADARKFIDQAQQIDPAGGWTQRALALRATLPTDTAAPVAAAPAGGVLFQAPGK